MRLIDAKEVERQIKNGMAESPVVMGMMLRWIRKQPTILMPCRCKECVWWKYNGADDALIPPTCYGDDGEHFCAYGERKGGGE